MKGLIRKDLYTYMSYKKNLLLMLAMGIVLGVAIDFVSIIPAYLIVTSASYATGLFTYDEQAKFDRVALTMPVKRSSIVLARYAVASTLLLGLTVIAFGVSTAIVLAKGQGAAGVLENAVLCAVMLLIAVLVLSILYPVSYRFGAEKGRIAITAAFLAIFGGFMVMVTFFQEQLKVLLALNWAVIGGIAIAAILALFALSVYISVRSYEQKEF